MHIWNRPWPFIYEHHNLVSMLLSVTFDAIATLVWAHTFVARWIRSSFVYFYLWPLRFVAVAVCGRCGCGRCGLWPFRFVAFRSVAVSICGRFGLWPFRFWPFRFVAVMTRIHSIIITPGRVAQKYQRTIWNAKKKHKKWSVVWKSVLNRGPFHVLLAKYR